MLVLTYIDCTYLFHDFIYTKSVTLYRCMICHSLGNKYKLLQLIYLRQIIFIRTLLRIDNHHCLSCQTYQQFLETSASPIWTHTRNSKIKKIQSSFFILNILIKSLNFGHSTVSNYFNFKNLSLKISDGIKI